jgi:hypothetical protein
VEVDIWSRKIDLAEIIIDEVDGRRWIRDRSVSDEHASMGGNSEEEGANMP